MEPNEYKCNGCGGIFERTSPEEEMIKEVEDNGWGDIDMDNMVIVCDDCYKKIIRSRN